MTIWRLAIAALVVVVLGIAATTWLILVGNQSSDRISVNYPEGVASVVPLGISAGEAPTVSLSTENPLAGDPDAIQEGKQFFRSLNCAGCHGYGGKGGIGPDLTDAQWRYGGRPIQIYKSIYEGRPKGMPAWGNTLPSTTIWRLVAYVQSLGGAQQPAPPGVQAARVPPAAVGETAPKASPPASSASARGAQSEAQPGEQQQPAAPQPQGQPQ